MSRSVNAILSHVAVLFVLLLCVNAARSQTQTDKDIREIAAYKLTTDDFTRLRDAQKAMDDLVKKNPSLQGQKDNDESDNGQKSIDQSAKQMEAHPEITAALKSVGLTPRHFVVITYALLTNSMANVAKKAGAKELPPGASVANMEFLEKHQKELEALQKDSAAQTP